MKIAKYMGDALFSKQIRSASASSMECVVNTTTLCFLFSAISWLELRSWQRDLNLPLT